jgi:hypothetical protein
MYSKIFLALSLFYCTSAFAQGYNTNNFDPEYYDSHYVKITTAWLGDYKALDILNDGRKNNQPILAYSGEYRDQNWKITPVYGHPGLYRLTTESQGDGRCLGVRYNKLGYYEPMMVATSNSQSQLWRITPVKGMTGYYRFTTRINGKLLSLDIINDGFNNNRPTVAKVGNYSGQYWKISKGSKEIFRPAELSWKNEGKFGAPNGAIIAGRENGDNLYICRAQYNGGRHPGKVVDGRCNIGYGGEEVTLSSYKVLVNDGSNSDLEWVSSRNGYAPNGAVLGGREDGDPLYICRAMFNGTKHPGKLVGESCNIGYGGNELSFSSYEVLVQKS